MSGTLLVLVGSPRRDGNSAHLAQAVSAGAQAAGIEVAVRFLDDEVSAFLRDCRTCRRADGECAIPDGYRALMVEAFLPSDAVIFCSPVYWYGLSAQTKAFFDRSFCYVAASHPESAANRARMSGKRIGLVLSSEETYPGAGLGIVHQLQEYCRYTGSAFVGAVRGVGNRRREVQSDPADPVRDARWLGANILAYPYSDYRMDSPRNGRVWSSGPD